MPASIAAITQLTDSVTRDQVTSHKQFAKPFRIVTLTSARTPATITAQRCRSYACVLLHTILHLPEKRVKLFAVFTPIAPVTISRHTVPGTRQTTASVTPIVLPFSHATPATTLEVTTRTVSVTTTSITAVGTALTCNVTLLDHPHIPLTLAAIVVDSTAMVIAITKLRNAEVHITKTAHAFRSVRQPKLL